MLSTLIVQIILIVFEKNPEDFCVEIIEMSLSKWMPVGSLQQSQ